MRKSIIKRFEEKIFYSPDGCWLWTGAYTGPMQYACFETGTERTGHRFSYTHFIGIIPKGMSVCHTCDVPSCVNPDHLFIGTTKDNMRDMIKKGRKVVLKGEQCTHSTITEKDATRIKGLLIIGLLPNIISKCMNIPVYIPNRIKRGLAWKDSPIPDVFAAPKEWRKVSGYSYASHKNYKKKRLAMLENGKIKTSKYVLNEPFQTTRWEQFKKDNKL